jgi:hypothetical protein
MGFMALLLVKAITKAIRNDRGWRRMEEDRKAQGKPFYGEMEEDLEKEKYGIED